jgi:murein DD-endopeptidase MepM/ murein hydrolase activator NlpD
MDDVHVRFYTQQRSGQTVEVTEHTRSAPEGHPTTPEVLKASRSPVPNPQIRNDEWGKGHYEARRRRGDRKYAHKGLDIEAPAGTPVTSPVDGRIVRVRPAYAGSDLTFVWIEDRFGNQYALGYVTPMEESGKTRIVKDGAFVAAGDRVGIMQDMSKANSGMKNHLHFEVKDSLGRHVDPAPFLREWTREK